MPHVRLLTDSPRSQSSKPFFQWVKYGFFLSTCSLSTYQSHCRCNVLWCHMKATLFSSSVFAFNNSGRCAPMWIEVMWRHAFDAITERAWLSHDVTSEMRFSNLVVISPESNTFSMSASFAFSRSHRHLPMQTRVQERARTSIFHVTSLPINEVLAWNSWSGACTSAICNSVIRILVWRST